MSTKKVKNIHRNSLRKEILRLRDELEDEDQLDKSHSITSRVLNIPGAGDIKTVLVYMHFRSEVNTRELVDLFLSTGKSVAIPKTQTDSHTLVPVQIKDVTVDVNPGYCGIPEPTAEKIETSTCDPELIDLVIVPGSVFDDTGGRLGYGGGYYDRFLQNEAPRAIRVGLAYELQIVKRVPVESHDQPMDYVVTEKKIYNCRRNRHA